MVFELNKWKLIQCQDEQIAVFLLDPNGNPISISGASEIKLVLLNADGSKLEKAALSGWSVGISAPLWVYSFALTSAETMALPVGNLTVEIKVLFGAVVRWFTYPNSLVVSKLPF